MGWIIHFIADLVYSKDKHKGLKVEVCSEIVSILFQKKKEEEKKSLLSSFKPSKHMFSPYVLTLSSPLSFTSFGNASFAAASS